MQKARFSKRHLPLFSKLLKLFRTSYLRAQCLKLLVHHQLRYKSGQRMTLLYCDKLLQLDLLDAQREQAEWVSWQHFTVTTVLDTPLDNPQ